MTKFWEGLGGKLGELAAAALLAPAAIFWAGGFAAWVLARGWDNSGERIADWFKDLSGVEQVLVAVGGLLVLTGSAVVVAQLTLPFLRLLEGYWPWPLSLAAPFAGEPRAWWLRRQRARFDELAGKPEEDLSAAEREQYIVADVRLRRAPPQPADWMPTRLGNILRAGETWPHEKYGLDAVVCWPRLWLVLEDGVKTELVEARRQLDLAVTVLLWGLLLAAWVVLTWWALLAAAVIVAFAYWWAVRVAEVYADLVEAVYDDFRPGLYDALRVEPPKNSTEEFDRGEELTRYLWRGDAGRELEFAPVDEGGDGSDADPDAPWERAQAVGLLGVAAAAAALGFIAGTCSRR